MSNPNPEKPPRAPREHRPWRVYELAKTDGDDEAAILTQASAEEYDDLREAEQEASRQAAMSLGRCFVPAKAGQRFHAEEVKRVEVRRS